MNMKEKSMYVTTQQGVNIISQRVESRKRAATNLELKINILMNKRVNHNDLTLDDSILAAMAAEILRKMNLWEGQHPHNERLK